ncbi:tRNA pseudouridine synthase A [Kordia zhangzhouensis]|uniref:pseudouridine synthase n=1 Tax=Kordia zhangzhouensis TaxID=1620405 RepID=UPI000629CD05|nr:pseudouridine synthase [Kordia zhangzhouensis]
MKRKRYYYLLTLQYLGFRYHGWQKQPDVNTVQRMTERTLAYVFGHKNFKLLAAGRTDAKVSANEILIELFLDNEKLDIEAFLPLFDKNLPQDIRVLDIIETDEKFNIIQHPKVKEYVYLFAFGEKYHPFAAPYMTNVLGNLDIELMKKGAKLFEGTHYLKTYCYKPTEHTVLEGTIALCEIIENNLFTANFFPETSYLLRVKGEGFKRHQIRMMMGTLILLGKHELDLDFIQRSLQPNSDLEVNYIAPASGLILNKMILKEK